MELTLLFLASIRSGLGLGFAGCFFLGHDDGSSRYARQSTRRLARWIASIANWPGRIRCGCSEGSDCVVPLQRETAEWKKQSARQLG